MSADLSGVEVVAGFAAGDTLGECPLWDERRGGLWWIDIKRAIVCFAEPGGAITRWPVPGQVGCLALTENHEVLVLGDAMWSFAPQRGVFTHLSHMPEGEPSTNRFNDGRVDDRGRLWIGTMDNAEQQTAGTTYLFDDLTRPRVLWPDTGIPNAMCFSPDNTRAYCGDSWRDELWVIDCDPRTGAVGDRRHFANVPRPGFADGACTDAEGFVWLCLWAGSRIVRFNSDGEIVGELPLPVSQPTCPAFGGPDLATLYVTTATVGLSDVDRQRQPLAGSVLAIDLSGLGIHGRPENRHRAPVR